jgi:hypothetical protein
MKLITLIIALFLIFACNSQKIINSLNNNNSALLESKTMLNLDFLQVYAIDTTKDYSLEYLEEMSRQNKKIQQSLYELRDSIISLKNKLVDEKNKADKSLALIYNRGFEDLNRNQKSVKKEIDNTDEALKWIERTSEKKKKKLKINRTWN